MTDHFTYKYIQWVLAQAVKDIKIDSLLDVDLDFDEIILTCFLPKAKHTLQKEFLRISKFIPQ